MATSNLDRRRRRRAQPRWAAILRASLLAALLGGLPLPSLAASAASVPIEAYLQLRISLGGTVADPFPAPFVLLESTRSGLATLSSGQLQVSPALFDVPLAARRSFTGFGGTLRNGPGAFFDGGAGSEFECSLNFSVDNACVSSRGFGGRMSLGGITHLGQGLTVWGEGGTSVGGVTLPAILTVTRIIQAAPWTTGSAINWYYLPIDPTPFTFGGQGTFRGLPSTFTGTGPPGFTVVSPVVGFFAPPEVNFRGVAELRIDFVPEPRLLLLSACGVCAGLAMGCWRARRGERQAS
jgi:hypothetical protein